MSEPKQQPAEDPAVARKRRKEIMTSLRGSEEEEGRPAKRRCSVSSSEDEEAPNEGKPSIRGIKKQARYVPGVPMTKEELREWRKEARRVRNRESAAASRKKTRARIDELEGELSALRSKYTEALKRIVDLQNGSADSFTPDKLRQDLVEVAKTVSPMPSAPASPTISAHQECPPLPHRENLLLPGYDKEDSHPVSIDHRYSMDMISRPTEA